MPTRIRQGAKAHLYITEWLEYRDLSVIQIAGRLGIDRSTIYKWINGNRKFPVGALMEIADQLNCSLNDLCGPPPPSNSPSRPSLDALVSGDPDDLVKKAADMIEILRRTG
jgi:transcriptional regulator with XRE-family HTH domain